MPNSSSLPAGPYDLIGDIHGCLDEAEALLTRLGYPLPSLKHPENRTPVFLGDLVDRGPDSPGVVRLVMEAVEAGEALCVIGNHDDKFARHLAGNTVQIGRDLQGTIEQFERVSPDFRERTRRFFEAMPYFLRLDEGRLIAAHGGFDSACQAEPDRRRSRSFALFGDPTGKRDAHGAPIRRDWAASYGGQTHIVHGHVASPEVTFKNRVWCIDTGCAYGGHLTALRWPEQEIVQVPAVRTYYPGRGWDQR